MKSKKFKMALSTILGSSALIGGVGLTVSSAWLITMASTHPPILVLSVSIVMVRFFGIFRSVARYAERVISHEAVFRSLTTIRVNLFEKINKRSADLIGSSSSGGYVKSIVDDVERAQEYALRITLPRYSAIVSILASLLLAWWIYAPTLILLAPISLILLIVIPAVVSRQALTLAQEIELSENEYAKALESASHGATEALVYGYSKLISENLKKLEEDLLYKENLLLKFIRKLQTLTLISLGIAITGTIQYLATSYESSSIPAVKVAMAIFLPLVAFEGITSWYPNLFISGKLLRAQKTIDELVDAEIEVTQRKDVTFSGQDVILEGVSVSWDKPFMSSVTASVSQGELLVIRGSSGSGKSTLALGLCGVLPYSGSIRVGGVELSLVNNLHQILTSSLQRTHIFNTTLRENLKIANPGATDELLTEILALLELQEIPLDTVLGEFGRPLSGGEGKRLSVGRALLSPAPILVLDEPTEHLDADLALRVEERIRRLCANRTLIVITHSGWLKSDRRVDITRE
jgi:ATP-binding cassette subfamily C protein CydC